MILPGSGGVLRLFARTRGRADAQFELTEALLCAGGPVRSLVGLSLAPEHRRGHGALYDGLNQGSIEIARLRRGVAGLPLPRVGDRIVLAAGVSPWLRPDAETSAQRLFCHVHGRAKGSAQMIPGWPYSMVAALQSGRSSWTAVLDAAHLGPADDATAVTAAQLREVMDRLRGAGHLRPGDPAIGIVLDRAGQRLASLPPAAGKPWPWRDHPGRLPIIEGTLIRLQVEHLPGDRAPKPLWVWTSNPAAAGLDVDRAWQAFLRRFDLEHTGSSSRLSAGPPRSCVTPPPRPRPEAHQPSCHRCCLPAYSHHTADSVC